jgi:hypothetical protein
VQGRVGDQGIDEGVGEGHRADGEQAGDGGDHGVDRDLPGQRAARPPPDQQEVRDGAGDEGDGAGGHGGRSAGQRHQHHLADGRGEPGGHGVAGENRGGRHNIECIGGG